MMIYSDQLVGTPLGAFVTTQSFVSQAERPDFFFGGGGGLVDYPIFKFNFIK